MFCLGSQDNPGQDFDQIKNLYRNYTPYLFIYLLLLLLFILVVLGMEPSPCACWASSLHRLHPSLA